MKYLLGLLAMVLVGAGIAYNFFDPIIPESPEIFDASPIVFEGTLESVNTGCFADGECFVMVDGKRITLLRGWSRDTVGSVEGVNGIGNLESHIGDTVRVYAQPVGPDHFTLYGDSEYYLSI